MAQLTATQRSNALGIIAAVKARGWGIQAAYIAVAVALVESGMRIIASANVSASRKYPHELLYWGGSLANGDGLGHDHASMGMYQQQTGYKYADYGYGNGFNQTTMNSPNGWGTPAELMDPEKSTTKFLDRLARENWQGNSRWVSAQNVQGSAYDGNPRKANNYDSEYGGNYQAQDARAREIVDNLWNEGFVMDKEVAARFDRLEKLIAAQPARFWATPIEYEDPATPGKTTTISASHWLAVAGNRAGRAFSLLTRKG